MDGITLTTSELETIVIHTENNIITEDNATAVITIPGSDDTNGVDIACFAVTDIIKNLFLSLLLIYLLLEILMFSLMTVS